MNANTVVEQKPVVAINIWDFRKQLKETMDDGWHIVPGTVVIAPAPDERYFAVVEK